MSQFSFGPANEQIPNATTSASGLMSATDKTKLDGISQSTMRDVPFAVAVADWTLSSGVYSAEFTSAYITASSKEIATYEANYRDYAKASISIDKKSGGGGMIFTTSVIPTGTITGHLYVWDNDDNKVPVLIEDTVVSIANGGTGQSSLAGVKSAFGIDALNEQIGELGTSLVSATAKIDIHSSITWGTAVDTSSSKIFRAGKFVHVALKLSSVTNEDVLVSGLGSYKPIYFSIGQVYKMSDGKPVNGSVWAESSTGKITYYGDNVSQQCGVQIVYMYD